MRRDTRNIDEVNETNLVLITLSTMLRCPAFFAINSGHRFFLLHRGFVDFHCC